MSSLDQMLDVLNLFSEKEPIWTVNDATEVLAHSRSTVYRYFRALTKAGLLAPVSGNAYALGPFIIKLDRQIRLGDPLLRIAPEYMAALVEKTNGMVILGRLMDGSVLCIHQEGAIPNVTVTFSRGLEMPTFKGGVPKAILANLPGRAQKELFLQHSREILEVGMGENWEAFKANLRNIRKAGYYVSRSGEVDPNVMSIGAPIFNHEKNVLAGMSLVIPGKKYDDDEINSLVKLTLEAAKSISQDVCDQEKAFNERHPPDAA
jgi:DNA-binding IclR family transcriptional regulator